MDSISLCLHRITHITQPGPGKKTAADWVVRVNTRRVPRVGAGGLDAPDALRINDRLRSKL